MIINFNIALMSNFKKKHKHLEHNTIHNMSHRGKHKILFTAGPNQSATPPEPPTPARRHVLRHGTPHPGTPLVVPLAHHPHDARTKTTHAPPTEPLTATQDQTSKDSLRLSPVIHSSGAIPQPPVAQDYRNAPWVEDYGNALGPALNKPPHPS